MAYATVDDVESRLGRQLTPEEEAQVQVLLEDAEGMIRQRIPDLDAKVASDENYERLVIMVEANAVIRVIRNPDAFIAETDGNYSYQRATEGASGYLDILPNEWQWLLGGGSMFQIVPVDPYGDRIEGAHRQPDAHYWCPPSHGFYVRVR